MAGPKPVILAVDDDVPVLRAVERDLRSRYGKDYRIVAADGGPEAPDAKRVLLTAYADTDVAIKAINDIRLDHYILKPWDPPDEKLYPVLDDLLADWSATFKPPFEGLRLLAGRWAPPGVPRHRG